MPPVTRDTHIAGFRSATSSAQRREFRLPYLLVVNCAPRCDVSWNKSSLAYAQLTLAKTRGPIPRIPFWTSGTLRVHHALVVVII